MKCYRRCLLAILAVSLLGLGIFGYVDRKARIPDSYLQTEGEDSPVYSDLLVTQQIKPQAAQASANAYAADSYTISYRYLGIFPLKESSVTICDPVYVTPGGIPVGIYMETRGILIIGTGEVEGMDGLNYEPAQGIVREGDYIQAVNGEAISDKEELIDYINGSGDGELVLDLDREGEQIQVKLQPVQTSADTYKLGIWVRDNTQGIGTLTFLTEDGYFGALGHGISDVDTGELLSLSQGRLYDTSIVSIIKGQKGSPGELSGTIRYSPDLICGEIQENTEEGIFGTAGTRLAEKLEAVPLQVGYKQEVETGEAWIRSSVSGTVQDYRVEITEIHRKEEDVNKGMVLKVTDPELLELTGGIVQGMSGSPIIQNGKIVGAVTHVFVNDPAKGYGIFLETMLEKSVALCPTVSVNEDR
jgi:stage IV sporulation protein B